MWSSENFKVQWERLPADDPGYATTVRFTIPTSSFNAGYLRAHIAIGHHHESICSDGRAIPRTDVAFNPQEPGYVALLEKAARWQYVEPPTARLIYGSLGITPRPNGDGVSVVRLGDPLTIGWSVDDTSQCRVAPADWSELDGTIGTPWKSASDSYTITHDKLGEYHYQLICDPGFAVGEEPEVIVVRVVADNGTPGGDTGSTPPPTSGAGSKPRGGGGSLGLGDLLLPGLLLLVGYARRRRHAVLIH